MNVALALLFCAVLMWHPLTRMVVWFLLPLGTGPDDLAVIGLFVAAVGVGIAAIRGIVHLPEIVVSLFSIFVVKRDKRKNEDFNL